MDTILNLEDYPLHQADSQALASLVATCKKQLAEEGMFNLVGFMKPAAVLKAAAELEPLFQDQAYTHQRDHNVYFLKNVAGISPDHPALRRFHTINHTICDDQMTHTITHQIYEWQPLIDFLAKVMGQPHLYCMQDPLARANVLEYRPGEALNWHFDRSKYTTTLLIQGAESGGIFEYASNLRSETDPNYEAVGKLLAGDPSSIRVNPFEAGTLNVFAGRNTLHRVTTVEGHKPRRVAVYSYYDKPDVTFNDSERLGFYGRTGSHPTLTQ